VVDAVPCRRGVGRARGAGCGARVGVADGWACVAAFLVRPGAARAARAASRDRHRGRGRRHGGVARGRRGHVRRIHARQRAHAEHSDCGRLQRHADASRVAGDASRRKRGGGSGGRARRRERSGGRRAVRPPRDPRRERGGRLPRSGLAPPAEAGGVSPRAAGPSRGCTGRGRRHTAGGGADGRGGGSRARAGAAGVGATRSRAALVLGLAGTADRRAPVRSAERTRRAGAGSCFVVPDDRSSGRGSVRPPAAGSSRNAWARRAASGRGPDGAAAAPPAADRIAAERRWSGPASNR
jgi:hypothetical protein